MRVEVGVKESMPSPAPPRLATPMFQNGSPEVTRCAQPQIGDMPTTRRNCSNMKKVMMVCGPILIHVGMNPL